ncbi:MAG TPA: hypothetical protein VFN61_01830 [Acidimicrobiales bacterium]|nr:hypothetical protein [Acidimicrobiales bacterium]
MDVVAVGVVVVAGDVAALVDVEGAALVPGVVVLATDVLVVTGGLVVVVVVPVPPVLVVAVLAVVLVAAVPVVPVAVVVVAAAPRPLALAVAGPLINGTQATGARTKAGVRKRRTLRANARAAGPGGATS